VGTGVLDFPAVLNFYTIFIQEGAKCASAVADFKSANNKIISGKTHDR
jgi:hypothetical protein